MPVILVNSVPFVILVYTLWTMSNYTEKVPELRKKFLDKHYCKLTIYLWKETVWITALQRLHYWLLVSSYYSKLVYACYLCPRFCLREGFLSRILYDYADLLHSDVNCLVSRNCYCCKRVGYWSAISSRTVAFSYSCYWSPWSPDQHSTDWATESVVSARRLLEFTKHLTYSKTLLIK